MEKKFNFVYKTKNLINGKIYIGVHSTNNLDDKYLGSGKILINAIKHYGKENFSREILKVFKTREEAYQFESKIVDYKFIKRDDTYNITEGGFGVRTHSKDGLKRLSAFNKNKAVMKNSDGKIIKVDKNSQEFKSGNLVGHTKNMITALANSEIVFVTSKEFKARNLVGATKGKTVIKINENFFKTIDSKDFDKRIHNTANSGKITAKDKFGNVFQIDKNDKRFVSGELVGIMKGRKFKQKNKQKKIQCPHCKIEGIKSNMKRWHFDNCKLKTV